MSEKPSLPARPPHQLFAVAVLAAVISLLITLSFAYADHSPAPHGVRVAVVAPVSVLRELSAGLDRAQPGGFQLVATPSPHSAATLVRSGSVAGGFVVAAAGRIKILSAGAAGSGQQQVINSALTAAAASMHRSAQPLDLVPLPLNDRAGLSSFVFELGLLLPSLIGSIGLFLLGVRFRIWWRVAAAALFSVLGGLTSFLVLDVVFGALTGSGAELIAIGTFGALSFVLTTSALQAALGMPGTGLAVLLLVFLGNAVSGGTVAASFLPDGFRELAPWLPNGAVVSAVRDVIYFPGADLGHPLVVLGSWTAAALAVLIGVDLLHMRARRHSPHPAWQIHATPGLAMLRRGIAGRGPTPPRRSRFDGRLAG